MTDTVDVGDTHLQVKQNAGYRPFLYWEKKSFEKKKENALFQPHILYTHHITALVKTSK